LIPKSYFLLIIFLIICIIPLIYLYADHGYKEILGAEKSKTDGNEKKSIRQQGEGWFFIAIAIFYTASVITIVSLPYKTWTYYPIIIITIAIIIIYYMRTTTGIPVLWTGVIIKEYVVDWNDVITKILQQILVVPATALLVRSRYYNTR
jgi:hypothetical protein